MPDAIGSLWSNGVIQNIVYLAMLLARLPVVEEVVLTVWPPPAADAATFGAAFGVKTVSLKDACDSVDVLIELGSRAEAEFTTALRERGGRYISYMAGNAMAMNFEDLANDVGYGDFINGVPYDACWITPQHWHMNHAYCEVTRSERVEIAPHIWHPICLNQSAFHIKASPFWRARRRRTGGSACSIRTSTC